MSNYVVGGREYDGLDIKFLMLTRGVSIPPDFYPKSKTRYQVMDFTDPVCCNCVRLPDTTLIHLINNPASPFSLNVDDSGRLSLLYKGQEVTEVMMPPPSKFYDQATSRGWPFKGTSVIEGDQVLSFPYLWTCEYAKAGTPCQFCFPGAYSAYMASLGQQEYFPTNEDLAEIIDYAVNNERFANCIKMTGGSSLDPKAECSHVADMLRTVGKKTDLGACEGEVIIYTTPPADPTLMDQIFEAGAHRVSCDMQVWDKEITNKVCPGHIKRTTREREMRALEYIASKYGANKACSGFVVGLEPVESLLEGAEHLAKKGIAPLASLWLPMGRVVNGMKQAPGLDYYRQVRRGLYFIFKDHGIYPPGRSGFNVCFDYDVYRLGPGIEG